MLRQIETAKQAVRFWKERLKTPRDFVTKYQAAIPTDEPDDLPRYYIPDAAMPTDDEFEEFKGVILERLEARLTRLEADFAKL